jgi:hypothetical protein
MIKVITATDYKNQELSRCKIVNTYTIVLLTVKVGEGFA